MKQNPRAKKVGWLPKLILLALCVYMVVVLVSNLPKIAEKAEEVKELERQKELQEQENELAKASDPSGLTDEIIISKYARERLGYVLPGERIFKDEAE